MLLLEEGTLLCSAVEAYVADDCFGTAPVSAAGTLAAPADGFGVMLSAMISKLHIRNKIKTKILITGE
jgi:hypothetical protein